MAHKKAAGSTSLGRDSAGQRLGIKISEGSWAKEGMIIVRQRGTKYHPGKNVKRAKDDTLFALSSGFIKFSDKKIMKFDNSLKDCKFVHVVPEFEGRVKPEPKVISKRTPMKKPGKTVRVSVKKTKTKNDLAKKVINKASLKAKPKAKPKAKVKK